MKIVGKFEFTAEKPTIVADLAGRTISGVAVPYNEVGMTSAGPVKFLPGSLTFAPHPFLNAHDADEAIGLVVSATDSTSGMSIVGKVSAVDSGDETLILASDGVITGLSVGVNPTKYTFEMDNKYGEIIVVEECDWMETSTVVFPAFTSARISEVAAAEGNVTSDISEANQEGSSMTETTVVAAAEAPAVVASVPALTGTIVSHVPDVKGGSTSRRCSALRRATATRSPSSPPLVT